MASQTCQWIGCVVALVAVSTSVLAQSTRIDGGVVSTEVFGFDWETHLTPPVPPLAEGFATSATRDASGVIHRVLLDRVLARPDIEGWPSRHERRSTLLECSADNVPRPPQTAESRKRGAL